MKQYANYVFLLFLLVDSLQLIAGQFKCKNHDIITNFNRDKFLGRWYNVARNPTNYDVFLKCVQFDATSSAPDTLALPQVTKETYANKPYKYGVWLKHDPCSTLGAFDVTVVQHGVYWKFPLGIIDIDYDSHVIFQGCDYKREIEYLWIVTRKRNASKSQWKRLNMILAKKGVDVQNLIIVNQDKC